MSKSSRGKGLFGWLGRQVGHVKKAVATDVTGPRTIYRNNEVKEVPMPNQPGMKLRRTVIDEVIVENRPALKQPTANQNKPRPSA